MIGDFRSLFKLPAEAESEPLQVPVNMPEEEEEPVLAKPRIFRCSQKVSELAWWESVFPAVAIGTN